MNLFTGIGVKLANFLSEDVIKSAIDWFPVGGLWSLIGALTGAILSLLVIVAVAAGILYAHASFSERVHKVTVSHSIAYAVAGVFMAILTLMEISGFWNILFHLVYLLVFAMLIELINIDISKFEISTKEKVFYWIDAVCFMLAMTLVGFFGLLSIVASVALLFMLIVGLFIFRSQIGVAFSLMMNPTSASSQQGFKRAKLDDGTEIENIGSQWHEVCGSGVYEKNVDGTFTKVE